MKQIKLNPKEGMLVAIPLSNNKFSIAGICGVKYIEEGVYRTIWCFYDIMEESVDDLISLLKFDSSFLEKPFLVCGKEYDKFEKGKYPVLKEIELSFTNLNIKDEEVRAKYFNESIGGESLLEMYLGILPWDLYFDPEYLNKRLLPDYGVSNKAWYSKK